MVTGNFAVIGQVGKQVRSDLSAVGLDRKSVRIACTNAFNKLSQMFSSIVFDLRRNSFQNFEASFESVKTQIEQMLNSLNYDRSRLVLAFNSEARPVCSGDNQNFDVRAALTSSGRIKLEFMDR